MNRLIDLYYIPLEDALQHQSFLFKENSTFWQERTLCSKKSECFPDDTNSDSLT